MIEMLRIGSGSRFLLAPLVALGLAVALSGREAAAQTGATGGEWRYYGADNGQTRYSPLTGIDRSNVADLEIVWRWTTANQGATPESRNQTTPLMIDGVLYFTAGARRNVVAVDAATGETLWMWRTDEGRRWEEAPRRNSGRGVAYWSDGAGDDRIFVATPGFHLVALDLATGHEIDGFGEGGRVDLMDGLRQREGVDPVGLIGNSSPPVVVGDVVIVGPAFPVGFRPTSRSSIPGDVRGYDARTGALRWTFHTIPEPGEFGHDTWENDAWSFTGNAGVWTSFTADEELGYVYLPVESATSDLSGGDRPGDNLFSSTLVALDGRTGERVWHFQIIHHDIWDYDIGTPPILIDLDVDGRAVKAVVQLTKQGFAYVFDRVTGEPVWPIVERPVPQTDVPGEWTAPTQPFPTRPPAFARQGMTEDDLIDFTPELRARALELVEPFRLGPIFTPPSMPGPGGTQGTLARPGIWGSGNWHTGAFDPETGYYYAVSHQLPDVYAIAPATSDDATMLYAGRSDLESAVPNIDGLPIFKPPYGRITAIDMNTGEHAWMAANGDGPRDHPLLAGLDVGPLGVSGRAAPLVTRTLLFIGEGSDAVIGTTGSGRTFRAYDKATGEVVWQKALDQGTTGAPMTYMHAGRQYIVVSIGDTGGAAEWVALALP